METLIALLGDANVRAVATGAALLGAGAGVLGCFAFLRKRALVGDALAHATLPGVCLAFLATGSKDPLVLLIGAMATGALGLASINGIVRHTRIKEDAALALTLSVFFGIGIVLLTRIQRLEIAGQAGLDKFLFGQAASLVAADAWRLAGVTVAMLAVVALAFKEFKLVAFDPAFAATLGWPVGVLDAMLAALTVLAVTVGLQLVGVVLMAAMLVTPAAAARAWTDRLPVMLLLAAAFGAISGVAGTAVSLLAPRMPTGPWIVVFATLLFAISLFGAPRRGLVARALRQLRARRKAADENVLKAMWQLGEPESAWRRARPLAAIAGRRKLREPAAHATLRRLARGGWVASGPGGWSLTPAGGDRARRVVRLHRLWELYLTERLHLAPDHVHDDAEEIEHVLTPELEAELEASLARPAFDPHRREIPYDPSAALPPVGADGGATETGAAR